MWEVVIDIRKMHASENSDLITFLGLPDHSSVLIVPAFLHRNNIVNLSVCHVDRDSAAIDQPDGILRIVEVNLS